MIDIIIHGEDMRYPVNLIDVIIFRLKDKH